MRRKQFLFLTIFLVVLVVAVVLLKRPHAPSKLADEVGYERIFPASLTADAIQGIDLYQGDQKDDVVQLRRQGDTWVAASYYDAPVKADKVSKLINDVSSLEGEIRADKAEVLDDFKLQDAEALHVLLYTDKPDVPEAHLLAGKSSGRAGFVRSADQNRVYSVNLDLRSEAGLYGDEADKVLEVKPWVDLQLHDVPKDQVTGIELQLPERRLQLALNKPESEKLAEPGKPAEPEKLAEKEPSEDGKAQSPGAKADKLDAPAATPEAKAEWELVEPKVNYPLKQGVVEGLVSTLSTLRGDDVVAPDNIAEYGLDNPPYRAVLTVEEKGKDTPRQVTVAVGKTVSEEDEKRYVRLEKDNSPVYLLPKWSLDQVFPTLGTILTLDLLSLESDDVVRVSWEQDGQTLALERQPATTTSTLEGIDEKKLEAPEANVTSGEEKPVEAEANVTSGEEKPVEAEANVTSGEEKPAEAEANKEVWRWVQAPEVDVETEKLEALLDTVEHLTADDWFADTFAEAGLAQPVLSLNLTLRNGVTHNLAFGQTRGKEEDRYVGVQGQEGTFVVAKTSYTSIIDALKPLRPEAPEPAAVPDHETMHQPDVAAPKPEMSSTEPAVQPASQETAITLPKQGVAPEAPAMMKMPMEAQPTPLSVPNPTSRGDVPEDRPATPATDTKPITPAKAEEQ